ncbi:hypothetical protein CCR94_14545 [Rhodoblastus sphagnicola]|uniref:Lysozyme inhibitor LprI N-terminal domain-containing protein n=1 Tax=Rhodoblastus sphagnicola TaxID=333368 RepID=A0A2S6N5G3_9HYPH|nr:hypothetical protein [Rhodoblastus sphagnicola]MBB4197247.1 hypothetical protein [Rhodoblastus sphagnicola]PPQ29854.1 hypothetical protein CCR94_14545 [Rhodoblastus sphagnicola]
MRAFLLIFALVLAPLSAQAQLALPGAVAPTPEGESMAPPKPHAAPRKTEGAGPVSRPKPPAESAILGQTLSLNGTRGVLTVEKTGDDLRVTRLVLAGAKVSHPNQSCEVAMGDDGPITLKALGAPDGATRYELQSSVCPMLLDLLGGALRVSTPFGACVFMQADCRADVSGLWGPPAASFSESQIKTFERERAGLEKSTQARFRDLLNKFKKKPDLARLLVKDQADFGASRSKTCRDYDKEETHGFCALRLTEARDLALHARLADDAGDRKAEKGAAEKNTRKAAPRKPAAAPRPTTLAPAAAPTAQPGLY